MADYGDILLEAVQTVVDGSLSKLAFDKTITAVISDNSNAAKGEYTVTDGSSTFLAYSDNIDFLEGTMVYINIPNGDFTKQKTITGKYITDTSSYYTYKNPWSNFVDITGNLIPSNETFSIKANDEDRSEYYLLKNYKIEDGDQYTTFGIKADFKTLLNNLGTELGSYGLKIYLRTVSDDNLKENKNPYKSYLASFSIVDMIGNPYNFESYYNQQKVFDISGLGRIYSISISLYQNNDFKDGLGNLIPLSERDNIFVKNIYFSLGYDVNSFEGDAVLLYTSDSETYDVSYGELGKENRKKLKVRWIHKDENKNSVLAYTNFNQLQESGKIHWYKYRLDPNVIDDKAGAFWEEISEWENSFEQEINCYDFISEQEVKYKVVVETPVEEFLLRDLNQDIEAYTALSNLNRDLRILTAAQEDYAFYDTEENRVAVDIAQQNYNDSLELYNSAIEIYTAQVNYISSSVLTFTNERTVADKTTLGLLQDLNLTVDEDGYKGVYTLYDETNSLQRLTEANKIRTITAKYRSTITGDKSLDSAESISWEIPIVNTMIQMPEIGKEFEEDDEISYSEDGQYIIITRNGQNATGEIGSSFAHATQQYFRIKNYYTPSATNNTITCYVIKDYQTYTAQTTLTFGPLGSNGTDYTFLARMESGRTCLYGSDTDPVRVDVTLYDYNNEEVPHAQNASISYGWYSQDKYIKIGFCNKDGELYDSQGNVISVSTSLKGKNLLSTLTKTAKSDDSHLYCYIRRLTVKEIQELNSLTSIKDEDIIPYYYILGVSSLLDVSSNSVSLGKTYLYSYLPIPFSLNYQYTQIEGTDKIIYNSLGTNPQYYKSNYKLFNGNTLISNVFWDRQIEYKTNNHNAEAKFYPAISDDGILIPTSMFIKNASGNTNPKFSIIARNKNNKSEILWAQPVMIYQNAYFSSLLNSWDGSYTVDEENGTVMATMFGAGSKDGENRFSGVLMGDVAKTTDSSAGTGIFGYHQGVQSFGFKNDGTAFIGKSNKGRIQFDGTSGQIYSMSYSENKTGMKIDLDDGFLEIKGASKLSTSASSSADYKETNSYIKLSSISPYFTLKDITNKTLMLIGEDNYYLQSSNFNLASNSNGEGGKGLKLDLKNDSIVGYNFSLKAFNSDSNSLYAGSYVGINSSGTSTNPYFIVHYKKTEDNSITDLDLMKISIDTFIMHSSNWEKDSSKPKSGIEFDLTKGTLKAYSGFALEASSSEGGKIRLSSDSPYLQIINKDQKILMSAETTKFYLQTSDYNSTSGKEAGLKLDLESGELNAFGGFRLYTKTSSGSFIELKTANGSSFRFQIKYVDTSTNIDLLNISNTNFIMQSRNWKEDEAGTKINMNNGSITSYKFDIRAYRALDPVDKDQYIRINSNATNYPIQVEGKNPSGTAKYFRVKWDGTIVGNSLDFDGATIGPFTITKNSMYTGSNSQTGTGIYFDSKGKAGFNKSLYIGGSAEVGGTLTVNSGDGNRLIVEGDAQFDGDITAKNATFSGNIKAANFSNNATPKQNNGYANGSIGGINYGSSGLKCGNTTLENNGKLTVGNLILDGSNSVNSTISFDSKSTLSLGDGGFKMNKSLSTDGSLTAGTNATINGDLILGGSVLVEVGTSHETESGANNTSFSIMTGGGIPYLMKIRQGIITGLEANGGMEQLGKLAFKDNVTVSAANFKIGSTNCTITNSSVSGATATYTVKIPAQGSVNTYRSYEGEYHDITADWSGTAYYVHIDKNGNDITSVWVDSNKSGGNSSNWGPYYSGISAYPSRSYYYTYDTVTVKEASSFDLNATITVKAT